jgi:hypothetical protein
LPASAASVRTAVPERCCPTAAPPASATAATQPLLAQGRLHGPRWMDNRSWPCCC